ncbi:MAG: hypothetical protein GY731_18295, partial [Gammaproteobacteria bacterium]|nr:hypothetical protein [Gammaproteobacteria bacterium]
MTDLFNQLQEQRSAVARAEQEITDGESALAATQSEHLLSGQREEREEGRESERRGLQRELHELESYLGRAEGVREARAEHDDAVRRAESQAGAVQSQVKQGEKTQGRLETAKVALEKAREAASRKAFLEG